MENEEAYEKRKMKLFEKEVARAVRKKLEDEKKKKKEEDQTLLMKRYYIKVLFKLAFSIIPQMRIHAMYFG